MIVAIFTLLVCELIGELLRSALDLPIPGPVIGMLLLAAGLAVRDRGREPVAAAPSPALDRTAGALVKHMGLLFVPAGVGIIAEADLLRQEWLPILAGLVGSTVLSLGVTGLVMHRLSRAKLLGATPIPPAPCNREAVP
jgi:holin-like protein